MKKYLSIGMIMCLCLALISWGFKGHQAVATIAENHLTPNAKGAVKALLGNQSLADVASWADEVRNQPDYKSTGPWHYVDLPLGLDYEQFSKTIKDQGDDNVYGALLKFEDDLKSSTTTPEQKITALKFIVHFVGDAHQPMHVSRAEDKGGNTIQVQFDNRGTNLHSLWDSKLIDHEGLTAVQMAKAYDTATPLQIQKWQRDDPMLWLWESYQISTILYAEVEKNNKLDDSYYNEHLPIVQQRIEKAGIRLAGVLNQLFNDVHVKITNVTLTPPPSAKQTADSSAVEVELKDLPDMLGKTVAVQGKVYGLKDFGSMTLVNLGAAYPNQLATVVLRGEAKKHFGIDFINGKTLMVVGVVSDYKGKPQLIVTDSRYLSLTGN